MQLRILCLLLKRPTLISVCKAVVSAPKNKILPFPFIIIISMMLFVSAPPTSKTVVGKWKTIDDKTNKVKSIVQIYKKDGKLYGKILKLFKISDKDAGKFWFAGSSYLLGFLVMTSFVWIAMLSGALLNSNLILLMKLTYSSS